MDVTSWQQKIITSDVLIPAECSISFSDYVEVAAGITVEIGAGATVEVT